MSESGEFVLAEPFAVTKVGGFVSVSSGIVGDHPGSLFGWIEYEAREAMTDRECGPRLGPGQRELAAVLRPELRRESARDLMPGCRPGRFVAASARGHAEPASGALPFPDVERKHG